MHENVYLRSFSKAFILLRQSLLAGFAFISLAAPLALAGASRPADGGVAVVFAPWTDARQAIERVARAEGGIARLGGFPFIAIAIGTSPDFARRVREEGAWLLLDPQALGGCLDPTNR